MPLKKCNKKCEMSELIKTMKTYNYEYDFRVVKRSERE